MTLTIGELFAGYGGLGMGVKAALGGEVAWVSDIDPGACKILAHRFPDVPNIGDITTVDWDQLAPVDVITGGFPCQDVSHAGRRAGLVRGETRTGLWAEMLKAIDTIRPRLVVAENVRGLLSARADSDVEPCAWCLGDTDDVPPMRALGAVLADLADIGYDAAWCGLPASGVGAPHGRFRIFILAWPADTSSDARRLVDGDVGAAPDPDGGLELAGGARADQRPVSGGDGGRAAAALLPTPSCSDTNGPGAHGDGGLDLRTAVSLMPTPKASDGEKGGPNQRGSSGDLTLPSAAAGLALLPTPVAAEGTKPSNTMGVERREATGQVFLTNVIVSLCGLDPSEEPPVLLPTPSAASPDSRRADETGETYSADGYVREQLGDVARAGRWGEYAPAIARWEAMVGRTAPAPTMTSTKGNRQLSPAFTEWMMGLPAGWITDVPGITRNEALKACGNGVVPQQAAEAVRWLWAYLPAPVRASLLGVAA